jgi:hypothetical protein
VSVDDIGGSYTSEQFPDVVGLLWCEAYDVTASQETTQLDLSGRSADLSNHRSRRSGNHSKLETGAMIGPDIAIVALSGNQQPGVLWGHFS